MEKEMTLNDGKVDVTYNYWQGQKETREDPPLDAEVEILAIKFEGINILDVVCPNDHDDLQSELYDYHADESNFIDI